MDGVRRWTVGGGGGGGGGNGGGRPFGQGTYCGDY